MFIYSFPNLVIIPTSLNSSSSKLFISVSFVLFSGFPGSTRAQELTCQCRRPGFTPWVGRFPWRRAWQPTPVFLPGESPWTEGPGGLQSMGSQRVTHDWATKHYTTQAWKHYTWKLGCNYSSNLKEICSFKIYSFS